VSSAAAIRYVQDQPVTVHPADAVQICNESSISAAKAIIPTPKAGLAHRLGKPATIVCLVNMIPSVAAIDTGATPSVITATYIRERDANYNNALLPCQIKHTQGYGGQSPILGIYVAQLVFPHPLGSLAMNLELLVLDCADPPYPLIIGREYQRIFAINVVNPIDPRKSPYVQIGKSSRTRWAIPNAFPLGPPSVIASDIAEPPTLAPTREAYDDSRLLQEEPFPSGREDITYDDFLHVVQGVEKRASPEFCAAMQQANINPELSNTQHDQLRKLILANQEVFALPGRSDYTFATLGEAVHLDATIPSPMPRGLKKAPYPLSNKARADIRTHVQDMISRKLVRPSRSPYAAPTFVVYRGDKIRFVHDWREMNRYLKIPAHPIPNMQALIRTLKATKYFSSFDIMDAFFMMALDEPSKELTAFVTEDGLWEFNVCSFGLAPFPGEFSSRLNKEFQVSIFQHWLKTYIDDILAQGKTWGEHLWQIFIILRTLRQLGARIKLVKAFFGYHELSWVGHKLNGLYLALDEGRVAAVQQWPQPKTRQQLMRLLGFTGYHQQFIEAYAVIVSPLTNLLRTASDYAWTGEHDVAFQRLKDALSRAVVLYMPDFEKPFIVYTDACIDGLAAALYQADEAGVERPLVFISRKLKDAERRYGASNLECLAVVWMLDKLHFYLDGAKFTIITDCVAVSNLLTAKWTHRQLVRWQAALQSFRGRVTIKHRAGKLNFNADAPSRDPLPNDRSNPAADLDLDQTIEMGALGLHLEEHHTQLALCSIFCGEADATASISEDESDVTQRMSQT
jgi:hypothetical protein